MAQPGRTRPQHAGGEVIIAVSDDGAGLDTGAIRAKAESRGLVSPGVELSAKELQHLIFLPGFSTSAQVTNISGRGVGMEFVVKVLVGVFHKTENEATQIMHFLASARSASEKRRYTPMLLSNPVQTMADSPVFFDGNGFLLSVCGQAAAQLGKVHFVTVKLGAVHTGELGFAANGDAAGAAHATLQNLFVVR